MFKYKTLEEKNQTLGLNTKKGDYQTFSSRGAVEEQSITIRPETNPLGMALPIHPIRMQPKLHKDPISASQHTPSVSGTGAAAFRQ